MYGFLGRDKYGWHRRTDIICVVNRRLFIQTVGSLTVLHILSECSRFDEDRRPFRLHGASRDIFYDVLRGTSDAVTFLDGIGLSKSI
jgi:hypothetical protein